MLSPHLPVITMGSHRKWRSEAKKIRRKRIRQKLAKDRDEVLCQEQKRKENSPKYQAWLSEQKALELFAEEEEARLSAERNAAWLAEEVRAQKAWKERQERLALARAERVKQELRIKEEWEEEQQKLKVAKQQQERLAQEKQHKQEELLRQIENFLNKGGDMPPEVNVASVTNPDRPPCPFFTKTGACRFGDRCSRNHSRPAISRVLLVPNFYDHIGLRQMNPDELEAADDWLEYEDSETYHHFLEFYDDVLPEWERVGKISQFKVCCNFEPHLRGNVYIEYESAQDAVKAYKMFHGRFYGGRQINVDFVNIDSWKAAICGQFHKHCCPKGRACNFLHVFRNPGNAFHAANCDRQEWRRKQRLASSPSSHRGRDRSWSGSPDHGSRRRDWRWSESPSPPPDLGNSSSHRAPSVRSHRSDRKRSDRRRDDFRSERSRRHDKKERYRDEQTEHSSRRSSKRKQNEEASRENGEEHHRIKKVHADASQDRTFSVNSESDCDNNGSLSTKITVELPHDQPNKHKKTGADSLPRSEKSDSKRKKSKKSKKDSHRKEKRRKKKTLRSESPNSSETSSSEK